MPKAYTVPQILFLLLVFFLPTQLGKHFWPAESFVLGIRIDYLSPTLYFTDIVVLCLLGSILLTQRHEFFSFIASVCNNSLFRFAALLFSLTVLGAFFTVERPLLLFYGLLKVFEMVFVMFCTGWMFSFKQFRLPVLIAFSCGMAFESLLAIAQFLSQSSVGGLLYYLGERAFSQNTSGIALTEIGGVLLLRPYGTLPHPNVLSGYLLIGSFFLFQNITSVQKHGLRLWFMGVILLAILGIVLSLSRVGIILALFVLGFFGVKMWPVSKKSVRGLSLLALCVFIVLGPLVSLRFLELSQTSQAVQERLFLLQSAIHMFLKHPLFGIGLNHFLVTLPIFLQGSTDVFLIQPVHNIFALILAEGGVVAILSVLIFTISLSKKVFKSQSHEKAAGLVLLVVLLTIGTFDHYLITLQQGQLLLSFAIGYLLSQTTVAQKP